MVLINTEKANYTRKKRHILYKSHNFSALPIGLVVYVLGQSQHKQYDANQNKNEANLPNNLNSSQIYTHTHTHN